MNFLIGLLQAAKGLAFISGLFGLKDSDIVLVPERIWVADSSVYADYTLSGAITPEIETLSSSGAKILLYLVVSTRSLKEEVDNRIFEKALQYDLISRQFAVVDAHTTDTISFETPENAFAALCSFRGVALSRIQSIDPTRAYRFHAYAVLGKTTIDALENKQIDLMYFWNYKRPGSVTEPISGSALHQTRGDTHP